MWQIQHQVQLRQLAEEEGKIVGVGVGAVGQDPQQAPLCQMLQRIMGNHMMTRTSSGASLLCSR